MSRAELAEHLQRLHEHATALQRRIDLYREQAHGAEKLKKVTLLRERLQALIEEGRRLHRTKP